MLSDKLAVKRAAHYRECWIPVHIAGTSPIKGESFSYNEHLSTNNCISDGCWRFVMSALFPKWIYTPNRLMLTVPGRRIGSVSSEQLLIDCCMPSLDSNLRCVDVFGRAGGAVGATVFSDTTGRCSSEISSCESLSKIGHFKWLIFGIPLPERLFFPSARKYTSLLFVVFQYVARSQLHFIFGQRFELYIQVVSLLWI